MSGGAIALIGMAGRFPGAPDVASLWEHVRVGRECISFFEDDELLAAGVPADVLARPDYVRASGALDDIEGFDAALFGFTARECEVTDPQHRLFLESAWHALEDAGYAGDVEGGRVGVFGGVGPISYLWTNVAPALEPQGLLDPLQARVHNDKDFLTTWVSYKLGLEGPSIAVQTACSTSLVAVHLACESLLAGDCDLALAGGAFVALPHGVGYLHQRGGVTSPDGHCRPFDASGNGFVMGSGAAVVVLKRLDDALRDRDRIDAVVRGSAVNNDGAVRAGFTAPGVDGQVRVITAALARAGVDADTIGYVETHGTGTAMGDPVEVEALTLVFGRSGGERRCALGAVKANVGHLDAAAGVTGLIKAALVLRHGEIPPVANFTELNPLIDLDGSPLHVPTRCHEWRGNGSPRRAGVTSLGMGGTNAHVVLEEAPEHANRRGDHGPVLLPLAARTTTALDGLTAALGERLRREPGIWLDDVAWTLQVGRRHLGARRFVVAETADEALRCLEDADHCGRRTRAGSRDRLRAAFVFPGQGAQYAGMGLDLYLDDDSPFRRAFDECASILRDQAGLDLPALLYGPASGAPFGIDDTSVAQPALFTVEYALAQQWRAWGVEPVAMAGHSIGEYVAACLAGVLSLPDAVQVVAERGRLMQACPPGSMLAVRAPIGRVREVLGDIDGLALGAVNGPQSAVVAGPDEAVARFAETAAREGLPTTMLRTSHAFHSPAMDEAVPEFVEVVASVTRSTPRVPVLSNLTGTWLRDEEAIDPAYWGRHLRATVRFSDNLAVLLGLDDVGIVEVGPPALEGIIRMQTGWDGSRPLVTSLPRRDRRNAGARRHLLESLGALWADGARVHWPAVGPSGCRRVALPLYPFERRRHWLQPANPAAMPAPAAAIAAAGQQAPDVAPASPSGTRDVGSLESVMLGIWRDVFGMPDVASTDNFFDLGGDSLCAIQLVNRIAETLGVELPMETLFDADTVADLAGVVKEARGS